MALNVGLGTHIDAQFVRQAVEHLVVGVVSGADGVQVVLLHEGQVRQVVLIPQGMTVLQVGVVAVYAPEHQLAAGNLHLLPSVGGDVHLVDFPEADALHHGLHHVALGILQLQHQAVQVGGVGEPLGGVRYLHGAGDGGARIPELFFKGSGGIQGHSLIVSGGHRGAVVVQNPGREGIGACLLIVQGTEIRLHGDVHITVHAGAVHKLGLHKEIPDFRLVLGIQVHIPVDTTLADEVLILQPAADGPPEHLQGDGVLPCFQVGGDVEIMGGEGIGGVAHLVAVHIEIVSGFHTLEGDENLPSVPAARQGKGGAVVAHRVVPGGGVGVVVVLGFKIAEPGQRVVGVHRLIVLEGTVLVPIGLPGLGYIFRLESVAGVLLGQILGVHLLCLGGVLHQGKIPVLSGKELVKLRILRAYVVHDGLFGGQSRVGGVIGDKLTLGPLPVDTDDLTFIVPLVTGEARLTICELHAAEEMFLPHIECLVIYGGAGQGDCVYHRGTAQGKRRSQSCGKGSLEYWFHNLLAPYAFFRWGMQEPILFLPDWGDFPGNRRNPPTVNGFSAF